jgi:hypothetical protein
LLRKARPYWERITADKKLRFTSPKLPSATSFIRIPLGETVALSKTKPFEDIG